MDRVRCVGLWGPKRVFTQPGRIGGGGAPWRNGTYEKDYRKCSPSTGRRGRDSMSKPAGWGGGLTHQLLFSWGQNCPYQGWKFVLVTGVWSHDSLSAFIEAKPCLTLSVSTISLHCTYKCKCPLPAQILQSLNFLGAQPPCQRREGCSWFLLDINQELATISKNHVTDGLSHRHTCDRLFL